MNETMENKQPPLETEKISEFAHFCLNSLPNKLQRKILSSIIHEMALDMKHLIRTDEEIITMYKTLNPEIKRWVLDELLSISNYKFKKRITYDIWDCVEKNGYMNLFEYFIKELVAYHLGLCWSYNPEYKGVYLNIPTPEMVLEIIRDELNKVFKDTNKKELFKTLLERCLTYPIRLIHGERVEDRVKYMLPNMNLHLLPAYTLCQTIKTQEDITMSHGNSSLLKYIKVAKRCLSSVVKLTVFSPKIEIMIFDAVVKERTCFDFEDFEDLASKLTSSKNKLPVMGIVKTLFRTMNDDTAELLSLAICENLSKWKKTHPGINPESIAALTKVEAE
jgi:hypothetical protein